MYKQRELKRWSCKKCGVEKIETAFPIKRDCKDGRAKTCRTCRNEKKREKNPERYLARMARAYQ